MKIEVNLIKLAKNDIGADEYIFMLMRILGKKVPLNIQQKVSLSSLEAKGFLKVVEEGFVPRPKLKSLFESIMETTKVEDWIDEWRELWPKGVKSGGKIVRGSKADCVKKMKGFLARTGYTKDQVFAAAQAYVLERKGYRYQYMTLANYFIKKDDDSPLEAWCELLASNPDTSTEEQQFHKEV